MTLDRSLEKPGKNGSRLDWSSSTLDPNRLIKTRHGSLIFLFVTCRRDRVARLGVIGVISSRSRSTVIRNPSAPLQIIPPHSVTTFSSIPPSSSRHKLDALPLVNCTRLYKFHWCCCYCNFALALRVNWRDQSEAFRRNGCSTLDWRTSMEKTKRESDWWTGWIERFVLRVSRKYFHSLFVWDHVEQRINLPITLNNNPHDYWLLDFIIFSGRIWDLRFREMPYF